jgi:cell division protein FtsB
VRDDVRVNRRPAKPSSGGRSARGGKAPGRSSARPTSARPGSGAKGTSRPSTTGSRSRGPAGTGSTGTGTTSASGKAASSGKGSGTGSRRLAISSDQGPDRPLLSLRALALVITLLVAFAIVAPTARHAIQQQEELRRTEESLALAHEAELQLQDELALWEDEDYIRAQARDRLGYTMPGQTPFHVVDPETVTGGRSEEEVAETDREIAASRPWYMNLAESIAEAGAIPGAEEDVAPEPDLGPETPSDESLTELPSTETLPD